MAQLQRPEWVYFQGGLVPWDDAVLHISTEAITRGLNVFEGLKGYWNDDASAFSIVALREHYHRLQRSARLLYIPFEHSFEEFEAAIRELVGALVHQEDDLWVRATLYAVEGHWGEGTKADLVMTAYHQTKQRPQSIGLGISSWQRPSDAMLPARIKTSTNYQAGRLARIEGRQQGYQEMVLLNQYGRVAEASGSCILAVREGAILTPPAWEGCLESITVDLVEIIARDLGIPFEERPVERTELIVADEIAIAGTLAEIVPVERFVDHAMCIPQPVLGAVADRFWEAVRGRKPLSGIDLTPVA